MYYRALENLIAGDFVKFGEPNKIKKCFSNEDDCLGQLEEAVLADKKISSAKIKKIELVKKVTAENITILSIPPEAAEAVNEELLDAILLEYKKSRRIKEPVQPEKKRPGRPKKSSAKKRVPKPGRKR